MQAEPRLGGFVISVHSPLSNVKQDLNNHPVSKGISPSFNLDTLRPGHDTGCKFSYKQVKCTVIDARSLQSSVDSLNNVWFLPSSCAKPAEEALEYARSLNCCCNLCFAILVTQDDENRQDEKFSSEQPRIHVSKWATPLLCTVDMSQHFLHVVTSDQSDEKLKGT